MKQVDKSPKAPPLDAATVSYLDAICPERSPDPADNEREVWMKAGERRLVRRLLHQFKRQQDQDVSA